jgi:hypothetical protein
VPATNDAAEEARNEGAGAPSTVDLDEMTKKDRAIVERYLRTGECPDDVTINLTRTPVVQKKGE